MIKILFLIPVHPSPIVRRQVSEFERWGGAPLGHDFGWTIVAVNSCFQSSQWLISLSKCNFGHQKCCFFTPRYNVFGGCFLPTSISFMIEAFNYLIFSTVFITILVGFGVISLIFSIEFMMFWASYMLKFQFVFRLMPMFSKAFTILLADE